MHNLPFVVIQIVGIVLVLFEIVFVIFQKPSNLQKILLVIGITCLVSFFGYLLELAATNVETAMYGCMVGYLSKPFSLLATLIFLLEYCNIKYKRWWVVVMFLFFAFLSTMVFTNQWHYLYYSSVDFNIDRPGSGLVLGHGVFWYTYMASTILVFIVYTVITIYEFRRSVTRQAKQMVFFMFLMLFFGIAGLICFITGITGGYDATLAGSLLGCICLFILLVRYRLFDTLTLAKEKQLIDSHDGLIVIDARMKISFYNTVANNLYPSLSIVGTRHLLDSDLLKEIDELDASEPIFYGDKVYLLKTNEITKPHRHGGHTLIGKSYVFQDVTSSYNYSKTLKEDIDKATYKIKEIQRNVIFSFADLVEARDGYTGTHIKNVAKYAKELTLELRKKKEYSKYITDEFVTMIEECAPLHDVGKIKIPDAILGKPGKLTKEEFEIMKTHTIEGGKIIDTVFKDIEEESYVDLSKALVTCHHEWWDGSGYPYGLKGIDIPLSARIMAIADVYDALRMTRPYKEAYSKEKSIEIMKSERGTHFDPVLLDTFITVINRK